MTKEASYHKLVRIILANRDFQESLSAITFILQKMDPEEKELFEIAELRKIRCFETTALVAYGRPFNSERNGKKDKLSFDDININLNKKEKALHEKLIKLRNTVYAHSDSEYGEFNASIGELKIHDEPYYILKSDHPEGTRLRWKEFLNFEALNNKFIEHCMNKSSELCAYHKDKFKVFRK